MVPNWERSMSRLYIVTLLIQLISRVHHTKCQLDEAQVRIKTVGKNINNFRYDTTLMAESKEELKNLLMKVKESEKNWLKTQDSKNKDHGIWSHHFMANRWGNNGNSDRLYFLGLQNHYRW